MNKTYYLCNHKPSGELNVPLLKGTLKGVTTQLNIESDSLNCSILEEEDYRIQIAAQGGQFPSLNG